MLICQCLKIMIMKLLFLQHLKDITWPSKKIHCCCKIVRLNTFLGPYTCVFISFYFYISFKIFISFFCLVYLYLLTYTNPLSASFTCQKESYLVMKRWHLSTTTMEYWCHWIQYMSKFLVFDFDRKITYSWYTYF